VSSKLWNEVTDVAGKEGISLSYALDKIIDEDRRKIQELLDQVDDLARKKTPKPKPKPKTKSKAKLKPNLEPEPAAPPRPEPKPEPKAWPWKRYSSKSMTCGYCGNQVFNSMLKAHEATCPKHKS